jgi:hypothetical protein
MTLAKIGNAITTAQNAVGLVKQVDEVINVFRPFKPEVRRFRIDYLTRTSEIKYLLTIPSGVKRITHDSIELPATTGFKIDEVIDMDTAKILKVDYDTTAEKWVFKANDFPDSERFLVTTKGTISPDFLNRLVGVNCAVNPTQKDLCDCYWIHSALKDVSILEKIWDELDIDRVDIDVKIGVERFFSQAIPSPVKKKLEAQKALLDAVQQGKRNIEGLKHNYRYSAQKTNISPSELIELMMKLVSGEFFSNYLTVSDRFQVGTIDPHRELTAMIPERVKVGVLSDLNLKLPVAKGELTFKKKDFGAAVTDSVEGIIGKKTK